MLFRSPDRLTHGGNRHLSFGVARTRIRPTSRRLALVVEYGESPNARDEAQRLADEQAALLRLATLVAEGNSASKIFAAVSDEVERLLESSAVVVQFEHDGIAIVSAGVSAGADIAVGTRWPFEDGMASAQVYRTRRSARVDAFDRASADGGRACCA